MNGYPKATCDPGTEALRLANERADRWERRHDALAARLASVEAWFDALENLQRAYVDIVMDTPEERETHRKLTVLAALGLREARAVLRSDAHTEQKGSGNA